MLKLADFTGDDFMLSVCLNAATGTTIRENMAAGSSSETTWRELLGNCLFDGVMASILGKAEGPTVMLAGFDIVDMVTGDCTLTVPLGFSTGDYIWRLCF
jgi:hypothetical protein